MAEIDFIFADDSKQDTPSRPGLGSLIATGGICVPCQNVGPLEKVLKGICKEYGFPSEEQFKWSPGPDHWMHENIIGDKRQEFFNDLIYAAKDHLVKSFIVIEDVQYNTATGIQDHCKDSIILFLERIQNHLQEKDTTGIILMDTPSGDKREEKKFNADCMDIINKGTSYVALDRIILNVITAHSKFIRLLQFADLITSCTTAYVAGEGQYSPNSFREIKGLLHSKEDMGYCRIGGIGLKIHPNIVYRNLYYWLLGDTCYIESNEAPYSLPCEAFKYKTSSNEP